MASLIKEALAANTPVTLAVAKSFLRVVTTDDDTLITLMLQAATEAAEVFTNRCFCTTKFKQSMDSFPYFVDTLQSQLALPPSYYNLPRYSTTLWNYSQMIKLWRPPVQRVDRITYLSSGDQQWHDILPIPARWYPGTVTLTNDKVTDSNGNVQQCVTPGTTNSNPPVWNKNVGQHTTEPSDPEQEGTGVVWNNLGPNIPEPEQVGDKVIGGFLADVDSEPARIFPGPAGALWPSVMYEPGVVQIHFTAGYSDDGAKVPSDIKMAILQSVAHWYENRETVMPGTWNKLPHHCEMLLWGKRVEDYAATRG